MQCGMAGSKQGEEWEVEEYGGVKRAEGDVGMRTCMSDGCCGWGIRPSGGTWEED